MIKHIPVSKDITLLHFNSYHTFITLLLPWLDEFDLSLLPVFGLDITKLKSTGAFKKERKKKGQQQGKEIRFDGAAIYP